LSSADQEETQINNADEKEIGTINPNLVFQEEVVQINSAEDTIVSFHGTLDTGAVFTGSMPAVPMILYSNTGEH
jgi:hypothetical protein